MFRRKLVFHQYKSKIFLATGNVMLMSYFLCCANYEFYRLREILDKMLKHTN